MYRIPERAMIWAGPFGMDLVLSIYYLAAPLVLIELGANPVELGLVGTITSSVHMGMANLMGRLSDQLGRRRLIFTAPVLLAASCLFMTVTDRIGIILVFSALNGLCLSLFWPPFQAWIADLQRGTGLARDIGIFNMSWTAAYLAGPSLSGLLYSSYPRLPFFAAAAFAFVLFLLTYTSLQDRQIQTVSGIETAERETSSWQRNFLYATWVANFASWFLLGNARYQFPKLARELNITPQMIGLLISCIGLSQFISFLILKRREGWHFKGPHLLGAQFIGGAGMLLISFSNEEAFFALALIMIGICSSVTYYSSLYYAVHLVRKKGKGTGLHESILSSGALLGPILGGFAALYVDLRAPYLLCLAVLGLAVGVESVLIRRGAKTKPDLNGS